MKKVALIGDSIRIGYQDVVVQKLSDDAIVWGPDWDGYTSTNVLSHVDEVIAQKADIVHVNCGLHDIIRPHDARENRVPLAQYRANVERFLSRLVRSSSAAILWATITPIDEVRQHRVQPFYRFENDIKLYNEEARSIAVRTGVAINDLYTAMLEAGPGERYTEDGVHFTEEGYRFLGEAVANAVLRALTLNGETADA